MTFGSFQAVIVPPRLPDAGGRHQVTSMLAKFIAYAGDCRIIGNLALADGERLSDILNRERSTTITAAELVSHADGHVVTLDEITLDREDVFAIEAAGSRGPSERRIHTVRHRLEVKLGPYTVLGQLHTLPGGQPLVTIGRRLPMIPLTNATIAFNDSTGLQVRDVETLIINREAADWVRAEEADLAAFPGVPVAPEPSTA